MSKKQSKKTVQAKIDTKVDEKEVRTAWLKNYVAKKDTAAKLCTQALMQGTTLQQMKNICIKYSETHKKPDGTQQKWGTSKNSDLLGHLRWISNKGYTVKQDDAGKYTVQV